MEQTTLQQRIEERAKQRLLKDLKSIADKEASVSYFIGKEYPQKLSVYMYYPSTSYRDDKEEILIKNDFTQKVFDDNLPRYIKVLQKIDEIDYLVNSKELQEDLP